MAHHGDINIRGINPPRSRFHDQGRFGRLFPSFRPFASDTPRTREALLDLGKKDGVMDARDTSPTNPNNPDNPTEPAGFTYFGQFIDHDITFDPTSSLERQSDPEAIQNFRTPQLELDNVYGSGPGASPHLYDRGRPGRFLIDEVAPRDLPRNSQLVALTGDPRNDENLIVSQIHLAFLKFHNAVLEDVERRLGPGQEAFEEAQRLVRWHYQWIVVNEFLPIMVGREAVRRALRGAQHHRVFRWRHEPFIPVEFAVAAYRFGHSQVRSGYRMNEGFAASIFSNAPDSEPDPGDLRGGKRAPRRFAQWRFFFNVGSTPPQVGKRIDTKLSTPLFELPAGVAVNPQSLAQRNLLRGLTFNLPSGQDMARMMRLDPLDPGELADVKHLGFDRSTPPWFYILREAEARAGGETLGPVGGRIVAEVMIGLLLGDRLSYLRAAPRWRPELGTRGDFTMGDLLKIARVDL